MAQYSANPAMNSMFQRREMLVRQLAMMPREKVGSREWSEKQQELARVESILADMRRWS